MPQNLPNSEQSKALIALGLSSAEIEKFVAGEWVVFYFSTTGQPGIALAMKLDEMTRLGIFQINDPGGGIKSLLALRERARKVAKAFGHKALEVFGAAMLNERFESLLLRKGFTKRTEACPEELGGGTVEILAKIENIE